MSTEDTDNRFVDIEIKIAHQEDMVESLNQRIYEQQKQIDKLEQMLHALAQHVRDNPQGGQGPVNERPPHY
ncbi:SlyX family protein [Massilia sp. Root418]|uniref:SlyX family protein n=1 Tax=Massilia sp. Root418 TaxID=1736532 RepID=UPI0009E8FB86